MLVLSALVATGSVLHAADVTTVYNITGATAFRAAANQAIISVLGGSGVAQYSFTGTAGINGTNRAIFKRTVVSNQPAAGDTATTIVRASWSGSTQGILDLADQNSIQFLDVSNPVSTTGINLGQGANPAPVFTTATPRFAFSDVDKLLSARPNSAIIGGGVGVVPFIFVAGESAPAAITNMTDQIHAALWSVGDAPASLFTGNSANDSFRIFATGRNNGSGTRAAVLSETQYGSFTNVVQYDQTFTGDRATGTLTGDPTLWGVDGNGGQASNSGVREVVSRPSNPTFLGGNYAFVSYLTASDAIAATGYNEATGAISGGEGAKPLTYNGVRYSVANVNRGAYSLWSFQQLYRAASPTAAETTFWTTLKNSIDGVLTPATGLPTSGLQVQRNGGDGGPISPSL